MRIKNFVRFINENLEPEPVEDKTIIGDVRKGEPEDEPDYDHFDYEDWQPTGDKPRKQNSDISLDFHPNKLCLQLIELGQKANIKHLQSNLMKALRWLKLL